MIGRLIVFEGIDGCGKSTQLAALEQYLRSCGKDVLVTRQPTSAYRNDPQVREYLDRGHAAIDMAALCVLAAQDRRRHVETVILPKVASGVWVLCDRYVYSTYAFFRARQVDLEFVKQANEGVPIPDLTVLLDLPPALARQRVVGRDGSRLKFEERSLAFMQLVRETYLACRDDSFLVLDAQRGVPDLSREISEELERRWPHGI